MGASLVLVVGYDYATFAATGSSLILGSANSAGAPTSVSRTTSGPVLNLHAYSAANPPFTTNARGLVTNLNAQMLSGQSLAQVQAGAVATAMANWNFTFSRSAAAEAAIAPMASLFSYAFSGVQSAAVPGGMLYRLGGSMRFDCDTSRGAQTTETFQALVAVLHSDGTWTVLAQLATNAGDCTAAMPGIPVTFNLPVPTQSVQLRGGDSLVAAVNGIDFPGQQFSAPLWPAVTVNVTGTYLGGTNHL